MADVYINWSAANEAAWSELQRHIDWAEGFWLVFVFSPSPMMARGLQQRTAAWLNKKELPLSVHCPDTPDLLVALIGELLGETGIPKPCTWIDAVWTEKREKRHTEGLSWDQAWERFLLRTNERRESLRRLYPNGLVLCASLHLKNLFRNAAPDLWSVRTMALELESPTLDFAEPEGLKLVVGLTPERTSHDPDLALSEARRLEQRRPDAHLAIAQVYARAAAGLVEAGRIAEARRAAEKAYPLMTALASRPIELDTESDMITEANTFRELGSVFLHLDAHEASVNMYRAAVARFRRLADADDHREVFLPGLAEALYRLGLGLGRLGKWDESTEASEEAVAICRRLASSRPGQLPPI